MTITYDPVVLKGIPEIFEVVLKECLGQRLEAVASFTELGPPDLCHIEKYSKFSSTSNIGSYHYAFGVDVSSPATISAYINSLGYMLVLS
jgi:hypothetical protein